MLEIKVIVSTILQRFSFDLAKGQKIVPHPITRLPAFGVLMNVSRVESQVLDEVSAFSHCSRALEEMCDGVRF